MLNNLEKLIQIYDDPPIDDASSMVRDPKPTKPETDKNKEILKYLTKKSNTQTRTEPFKKIPRGKVPIKLAKDQEDLEEEFRVIEIPMIMKEYEDWIKENPGKEFREFLKEQKLIMNREKKRLDDMILSGALAKIDNVMSGIMSMAPGGIIKDPSYTYYSDGGSSGNKPKDPAKAVRKLNLADYFQYGMRIADLTDKEREVVNELLKKTFSKSSTNN